MAPAPASLVAAHPELQPLLRPAGGSQRARLLEGMTQAVYRKGYAAATVADAVREARVSRGTFYAEFASKEECFLEAYRHGVDVLLHRVATAAREAEGGWEARLRAGLRAYLAGLAGEPRFARTYLLEIQAAGARAQTERDAALRRFAERYASSFAAAAAERPELSMPSDDLLFGLAAGVSELICARLRAGEADRLPDLEDPLVDFALAVLEGASTIRPQGDS
jgi:AcrR family transcriptional regulator